MRDGGKSNENNSAVEMERDRLGYCNS